jgi:hypothetical protein
MATGLFIQSRSYAKLLKENKGIDYSTCKVDVLADGYCDATDNGEELDRNLYISGLILRFWYTVKKMQEKSPGISYGEEEFADWLYEAIEYACKYRAWRDPNKKVNAQQAINQCIETIRLQHYYQLNLQKHKASFNTVSLESTINNGDLENVTLFDTIADEDAEQDMKNVQGGIAARMIVQSFIDKKDLVGAIISDLIAFNDCSREIKKVNKYVDEETGESYKTTTYSSEFWPFKAVQAMKELPNDYAEYFMSTYKVKPEAILATIEAIRKANSQKLYKYLRDFLTKAKATMRGLEA